MNKEIWDKPRVESNVGGEALIEGVMMRGNGRMAYAIRKADGSIELEVSEYTAFTKRYKILALPFIRGAVSFVESMFTGVNALMSSAEKVDIYEDDGKEDKFDIFMRKILGPNYFQFMMYFSVIFALVLGVGLFMLFPNWLADLFHFTKTTPQGAFKANLLEGGIRLVLFLGYILLVSRSKDIHRVFQYHGAEHKSIFTLEAGEPLTVENARRHTRLHPRCGTTFLFVVMFISIIVFAFAGWHSRLVNMLIRLALLPVIAGLSYELFRLAAKAPIKALRLMSIPGIWLQNITTQEPDDSMLEVALTSLRAVLEPEWANTYMADWKKAHEPVVAGEIALPGSDEDQMQHDASTSGTFEDGGDDEAS